MQEFDVVIVGGGLNGASLAVALAPLNCRVAMIDAFTQTDMQEPAYDDRSIALSYGSSLIFKGMDVWSDFQRIITPIDTIHVSDRGHLGATRMSAKQEKLPALGYLVENQRLIDALYRRVNETATEVISPAVVETLEQQEGGVVLQIRQNQETQYLRTGLVVGADGTGSKIRALSNIGHSVKQYEQTAIVANLTPEKNHDYQAFERFTEHGPIALLPLSNNRCSLVWTHSSNDVEQVMALDDATFLQALNDAFGYRLGRFVKVGRRAAFPLSLTAANAVTAQHTVLIGNAAQTLHPVAGQGLNIGLRDIAELVEQIAKTLTQERVIGDLAMLTAYSEARQQDRKEIMNYTHSLVRIFSNDNWLLGHMRAGGLMALDRIKPLQRLITKQSMGFRHRHTRLARGLAIK